MSWAGAMQPDLLSLDVGPVLQGLDIVGLTVFAASGALTAAERVSAGFTLRGAAIRWGLAMPQHKG